MCLKNTQITEMYINKAEHNLKIGKAREMYLNCSFKIKQVNMHLSRNEYSYNL